MPDHPSTWNTDGSKDSNGSSNTSSTSSSSKRFNLDETDTSEILVYRIHHGSEISSQSKLCKDLDAEPTYRCSRKEIPRGMSRLDIKTNDLFNEPERTKYKDYPNSRTSYASIGLPSKVYWRRLLFGQFTELYIVSPGSSPASSADGSLDGGSKDHSPIE